MPRTKISKDSFKGQSIYVGIDCHHKSWKVTLLTDKLELKTMSRDPDVNSLADYLKNNYPGAEYKVVYESGFNGFTVCRKFRDLGIDCQVVHAMDVPTSHKDRQQKSDKSDSRKLAQLLRSNGFEGIDVPPPHIEVDRKILRQHYTLTKMLTAEKNRVKAVLFQFGIEIPGRFASSQSRSWSRIYIEWLRAVPGLDPKEQLTIDNHLDTGLLLRKQLLKVTRQIRDLSKEDNYKEDYRNLSSIPGIGTLGAMRILLQIYNIERFKTMDELCSYIGLMPKMYGSGERTVTGELTKRGRKDIKVTLVEASWVAVRKDPALTLRFNKLILRMNKNKAIIRIAKNLLNRIKHMLTHKIEYELGIVV
ncbi:IS110 family transposase [Aquiflexum sp.]|uniref:IS110 family transposase n=1 Tax=Aquiflexum sp. TaxID=1872584 RepID=UPI003593C093